MGSTDSREHARPARLTRTAGLALAAVAAVLAALLLFATRDPQIRGGAPRLQQVSAHAAGIAWETPRPGPGAVELEGPNLTWRVDAGDGVRHHAHFDELTPDTAYRYRVLAAGEPLFEGALRTAPLPGAPFDFAVLGDSGKGSSEQYQLARQIARSEPDFVLHAGDVLYRTDVETAYLEPYAELIARVALWPAWGNHDLEFEDGFLDLFDLPHNGPTDLVPGRNYFFDWGDARIAVIDSNHGPKKLRFWIGGWLREVFADPAPRWRIVVLHHPPYTAGGHEPSTPVRESLVPIFEEVGVDIVFSGHDHNYQRTAPMWNDRVARDGERGIVYIVTGAGGGDLYPVDAPSERPDWLRAALDDRHSFTFVRVTPEGLSGQQIDLTGAVVDRFAVPARARATGDRLEHPVP